MLLMLTFILLTVGGAVLAAMVGTFWYSPATPMGRLHMRYVGFDVLSNEEKQARINEAKPRMPKMYVAQLLLSLLTSAFVVGVITLSLQNGIPPQMAVMLPLMSWLCFVVPTVGSAILWGNCDPKIAWQKFFSDILCILVTILLIAGLTILFTDTVTYGLD